MITLKEHIEISRVMQLMEGESPQFTDDQLQAAEFYTLKWNPVSGNTRLCLFNADGEGLGDMEFQDPDVAVAFVEEFFDIDEEETAELESYSWANDNYDDRVQNAMADDGTTIGA